MRPGHCFVCHQKGHMAKDCEVAAERKCQRLENITCFLCCENDLMRKFCPDRPEKKCFICQEEGHLKNDCPKAFKRQDLYQKNRKERFISLEEHSTTSTSPEINGETPNEDYGPIDQAQNQSATDVPVETQQSPENVPATEYDKPEPNNRPINTSLQNDKQVQV